MKKFLNVLFVIGSVTALFSSCKKEELSKPQTIQDESAAVTSPVTPGQNLVLAPAPIYTLTKRDKDSVIYYNDGRLGKVQSPGSYIVYNYGFTTITSKKYNSNNQLVEQFDYQIDVQKGRVFEALYSTFSYFQNGTIVTKKTFKYEYNADGQLTKKYNKDKPLERTIFAWFNGNLVTIDFYNEYNDNYSKIKPTRHVEAGKLKLQPKRSLLDPYLKIFGKGSKNIEAGENVYTNATLTTSETYNYLYNADGYPTKCIVSSGSLANIIKEFYFSYAVSR